jgi:hypothetical protein
MIRILFAGTISVLAVSVAWSADWYSPPAPYSNYPDLHRQVAENCPGSGRYKIWCRQTQLSHVPGLSQITRYTGIACSWGDTPDYAELWAKSRAGDLVLQMQFQELRRLGIADGSTQTNVSDGVHYHCAPDSNQANISDPITKYRQPPVSDDERARRLDDEGGEGTGPDLGPNFGLPGFPPGRVGGGGRGQQHQQVPRGQSRPSPSDVTGTKPR